MILFLSYTSYAVTPWSGIIASSRAINWSNAGIPGGLPDANWTQCGSTIAAYGSSSSPASTSTINSAISGCPPETFVQLGAGTFYLTGVINLKDQVVLRGMGANQTFLTDYNTGAGTCNGQYTMVALCGDSNYYISPENTATWTAGFAQGTTSITLSNSLNIVANKTSIILDQQDTADTGNLWTCAEPAQCGGNGGGGVRTSGTCSSSVGPGTGFCTQQQKVLVTACSPSCNNAGSTVVTISPGLYAANWNPADSTGAWWATTIAYQRGVENLSIDLSNLSASCVVAMNAYEPFVSGIRCIDGARNHIYFWDVSHGMIVNNYFYENLSHATQSYGVELFEGSSDNLVMNNIFQQVTDSSPSNTSGGAGNVAAYNFAVEDIFGTGGNWFQPSDFEHSGGDFYWLREGNVTLGLEADDIHGTHNLTTAFRNRYTGWETIGCGGAASACPAGGASGNSTAVNLFSASRYFNIIGNVIGQADYHTNYTALGPSASNQNSSVYYLSGIYSGNGGVGVFCSAASLAAGNCNTTVTNYDPLTQTSLMRWGNWDVATAGCGGSVACSTSTVRWCGNSSDTGWSTTCGSTSETASAFGDTTGTTSSFINPVPSYGDIGSGQEPMPPSFFLSSKPSWWGSLPWPGIGPDVTGGNMGICSGGTYANSYVTSSTQCAGGGTMVMAFGGHANSNPAMNCYLNIMSGPPDGSGSVLSFNANTCYSTPSVVYGEVLAGDTSVTLNDAVAVAQYAIGLPVTINVAAAEVDGTSTVTLNDAVLIAQYVVGLITKFPVQG